MVSERLRLPLVLILAFAAAYLTYHYLAAARQTVTVVVARSDIKAGTPVTADMVRSVTVSAADQQALAPTAVRDPAQVAGRALKRDLKAGAVLTLDPDTFWLAPDALSQASGGPAPPAYLIPAGKVAFGLPGDPEGSVGYLLQKGDRVDVIWTGQSGKEYVAHTVVAGAEVFDLDQGSQGGFSLGSRGTQHTITLLVTPEEAERLALARRTGKLDLALTGR